MKHNLIQPNFDLTALNTLNVSAEAKYYASLQTIEELKQVIGENAANQPIFVLGGGSNVLFANDYNGFVIHPKITGKKIIKEDEKQVWLKVGAGENWHKLVRYCVNKGWGGVENLSLIPGWVGAAPIQNIGAYGVEFDDVFYALTALELTTGKEVKFGKKECDFGYRDSIFKREYKDKYVITDVTIQLDKNPTINTSYGSIRQKLKADNISDPTIKNISDIVIEIRKKKLPDPSKIPNAGSFFKNPIVGDELFESLKNDFPNMPFYAMGKNKTKIPAGWLIEKAGWKQKTKGKTGVYSQQALVIINKGQATGEEILSLAKDIQHSVERMFGIKIIPEVNIVH